jgi:hypothetical protein
LADKPQVDKFRELARELEADGDEGRFDGQLKKLAATRPRTKADKPADGET